MLGCQLVVQGLNVYLAKIKRHRLRVNFQTPPLRKIFEQCRADVGKGQTGNIVAAVAKSCSGSCCTYSNQITYLVST